MRTQLILILTSLLFSLLTIGCAENSLPIEPTYNMNNHPSTSCADQSSNRSQECKDIENEILASTVRIEFREWQHSNNTLSFIERGTSHGTIKDGRYLITHNHFSVPLTQMQKNAEGSCIKVSIYRTNGNVVLQDMPLTAFNIVFEDEQLLIFDFLSYGDQGLFAMLDIPSAQFTTWSDANLQVGAEVAQLSVNNESLTVNVDPPLTSMEAP